MPQSQSISDREVLKAKLAEQERFTLELLASDAPGSRAIALGRTAGLAKQVGEEAKASHYWGELARLTAPGASTDSWKGMPSLDDYYAAYQRHAASGSFGEFAGSEFTKTPGLDFSNAAGAYAFALDGLRRDKLAVAQGGELKWVYNAGAAALRAGGFEEQAQLLDAKKAEQEVAAGRFNNEKKIAQR